ncbi:MAG: thiolase family protein [Deltaproteobacteria bacterium]|nr:thiolase family protein [Candidatus Anaeroferrophillus wilburensis]MBN2889125.1 thiolase family protein [Deltaproteobacteria bacterium]
MFSKAFIPYGGYFSSPFARWQGSLANENAIILASSTAKRWLAEKNLDPGLFEYLFFGFTIPQHYGFYASPWAAAMMGADRIPGCIISQACSTSTTCIYQAALGIEQGEYQKAFTLMADRCSNGPHLIWPNPKGPGGQVESENWLMDNFGNDPWARNAMIETAENVAKEGGITREACDELTLRRYEQYGAALADDRAFQKRYMFPLELAISKKKTVLFAEDEGIMPSTAEGLAALKPVLPGGVHTFGSQTHPGDGNCGLIVTDRQTAKELSSDASIEVQVLSYGFSREKKGYMAAAVVPAAERALAKADITAKDVKAIKTHNPFAVNDLYFAGKLDIDAHQFNNYGSSLIFGHPQGPTAGRCIIELIEELAMTGGGYGMFAGCAAGDTAAALVLKVTGA